MAARADATFSRIRPDQHPGSHPARDGSLGAGFQWRRIRAIAEACTTAQTDLQDRAHRPGLCRVGARRVGSRPGQRAGPGDRVLAFETGISQPTGASWRARSGSRLKYCGRLAQRCRSGGARGAAARRSRARDQGRDAGAQRDSTGVANRVEEIPRRDRSGGSSGAVHGRRDLVARLVRRPHGCVGIDVVVAGSQKGLMMPSGMSFTGAGPKALAAAERAVCRAVIGIGGRSSPAASERSFPATAPVHLFFGLREAIAMLEERGSTRCFARHHRLARRRARRCGLAPE